MSLIQNLTRFEDKSIITAFDLFNPTNIPSDPSEFVKFGNENVRKLSEHYQSSGILNGIENCFAEWSSCKQQLIQNSQLKKHGEVIQYLSTDSVMHQIYPNLCTLAQICHVVPIHSADVERTFLQLKMIKSNIRNRMLEKTLDSLLRITTEVIRITTEGPKVNEFPFKDAVALWACKKNRCIKLQVTFQNCMFQCVYMCKCCCKNQQFFNLPIIFMSTYKRKGVEIYHH